MFSRVMVMREATVRIVKMLSEKEVNVTQRGSRAYVEYDAAGMPVRVNIPYLPDDAGEDLINATQGFMDHEVAHILFTDPVALRRAASSGVAKLHNIIEDSFIERRMAQHFSGSGMNLQNMGIFFLRECADKELKTNPDDAAVLLFVPAVRAWAGQTAFVDYMSDKWHHMTKVTSALGDLVNDVSKCATSDDCVNLAIKFKEALDSPEESDDGEGDGEGEGGKKGEGEKKGEKKKSSKKPKAEKPESEEKSEEKSEDEEKSDGDADTDSDTEGESSFDSDDGGDSSDESDSGEDKAAKSPSGEETDSDGAGGSLLDKIEDAKTYDDSISEALSEKAIEGAKDSEYLVYTTELDRIEPLKISSRSKESLKGMTGAVDHMVGPLQKDLERAMAARSAATWSSGHRTGRLHSSSLARLVAFKDDKVFRRKHISESKDVAVTLLIDCSGSMSGSRIQIAAYTAYGLSSVLDRMMISHEVLGFTTRGDLPSEMREDEIRMGVRYGRSQGLYIPIVKGFGERLTSEPKRRFAELVNASWLHENVDGESLQIAAARLAQRREKRKILMVLSDGSPACPGNRAAQIVHLKKVTKDVARSGIDLIAIGIQTDSPTRFYEKSVSIHDIKDLPTTVIGQIKNLLLQ